MSDDHAELEATAKAIAKLLLGSVSDPGPLTQRDADAVREAFLVILKRGNPEGLPFAECWPTAEGVLRASCRDHGAVEPLFVFGSLWCPQCLEDPRFEVQGDSIVGPSLEVTLEEPVNFITVQATIGGVDDDAE